MGAVPYTSFSGVTAHPLLVSFAGARFFVASAEFRLGEASTTKRDLLMRYSPDSLAIDFVRCMPQPEGKSRQSIVDIAASETGVFILRETDARGISSAPPDPHVI